MVFLEKIWNYITNHACIYARVRHKTLRYIIYNYY